MGTDRRRVRSLIVAVFVPVVIVIGVLASAVLGDGGARAPDGAADPGARWRAGGARRGAARAGP